MKKIALLLISLFLCLPLLAQTKVGDATLSNTFKVDTHELILNGAGLREKLWFDLYACGLYLQNKNTSASSITTTDQPMVMHLEILSRLLSKKKMIGAFKDGFNNTNTPETINILEQKFTTFISFLHEDIEVGDKYNLVYTPTTGTTLFKNNNKLGTIESPLFKTAIFNIWLSQNPVDSDLKEKLLGSSE